MAVKIVNSVVDLSQGDRAAFMNLLSWGQRAILATAPFMEQKLLDDLIKAARAGQNPTVVAWLAARGYQLGGTTATSAPTSTGGSTTDPSLMDEGSEQTVNGQQRFIVKDYYGHTYAETPTADGKSGSGNIDYVWDNGKWVLIRLKTNALTGEAIPGAYTAVNEPSLTGKVWDQMQGWVNDTATTGTTTTTPTAAEQADIENTQANTAYTQASTQKLLADLNSPTSTDDEKNAAAIQLYGILADYAASSNATNTSQWGNQAGAFNQAYGNAIEQNKWLQDMSTSPLNTVAYLNLIRGQNPPNWNLPNYQQMPDAFTGWNQQQPTQQGLPDTATIQSILAGLGWGNTQTTNQTANTYGPGNPPPAGWVNPNQGSTTGTTSSGVAVGANGIIPGNVTNVVPPVAGTGTSIQSNTPSVNAMNVPMAYTANPANVQNQNWTQVTPAPTTAQTSNWNLIQSDIERMKRLAALAK